MEAPPAVITTNLGESMTNYLEKFMEGDTSAYQPTGKNLSTVISKAWSRSLSTVESSGPVGTTGCGRDRLHHDPGGGPQPHLALPVRRRPLRVPSVPRLASAVVNNFAGG